MYTIAKLNVSLLSIAGVSACLASTADLFEWDNAFDRQRVRTIHFMNEEKRIEDLGQYLEQKKNQIVDLEDLQAQVNRFFKENNIQNNLESIQEKAEQLATEYFDLLVRRKIIYEAPQQQVVALPENNPAFQVAHAAVEERQDQAAMPAVHPHIINVLENDPVIKERAEPVVATVIDHQEDAAEPVVATVIEHQEDAAEPVVPTVIDRQEDAAAPVVATVIDHQEDAAEPTALQQTIIDPKRPEDVEPIAPAEVHPKFDRTHLDLEQPAEVRVASAPASYIHIVVAGEKETAYSHYHVALWPTLVESTWNSIPKGDSQFHPLIVSLRQEPLDNHYKHNFRYTISQKQNEGLGIATPGKTQISYAIPITTSLLAVRDSPKFSYEGIPLSALYQIKLSDSQIIVANNNIIVNIIDKLIGYISSIISILLESSKAKHHDEGV